MENIETQQKEDGNRTVEPFASIMGPEHPGRLRLYGRGVTKTKLRGKVGYFEPSSNATTDLQRMEEKIQRLEEKIQEQNRTIRKEVVLDVLAQLQSAGHELDANIILRAMGDRSAGEKLPLLKQLFNQSVVHLQEATIKASLFQIDDELIDFTLHMIVGSFHSHSCEEMEIIPTKFEEACQCTMGYKAYQKSS